MELKQDETKNLQVYAFPDQAKMYKDEVICLLRDNPNPIIFNVQCLGAKPVVEVDQDIVEFDRLLLEKKLTKTLTLKNVCAIPVKWKLNGVEGLPEEFQVSKTNGMIKPCKDEVVEITFTAKKEQKFNPKLTLEVEDTEGYNVKQENKVIEIKAEAFKISLDIKFSHDQILDFEAVRVGEPKENKLYLKNIGMYPVKYNFNMKKKQTREIFTIEPMEGELQPNEEKNCIVKFMSQKEIKLRTTKNTSDIVLNILEGKSQETHNSIPINVNVNAVFSKYSITPLKNINFGPMQYGEQVNRTFEIRNEGQFEFKFALCDYKDEEGKKKIREERQKEMEERIKGLEEKKEEVKDPKKKPEPAKPPPKKADPKAKDQPPEGGLLEVVQYSLTPATGLIPPNSAAVVNVTFKAKGAKFYESTIAIDVANRDPNDQPEGIPFELCAESSIPGINTEDLDQIFEEQTVIPSLDPSLNTQTVIQSSLFAIQERVFWFGTLIAGKTTRGEEKFKIMNPNKINCIVKFAVKARSQSKSEGFAFDVKPDVLTIEPHKHKYVTVGFNPQNMMTYGGIFEATVENGDPQSKTGKLTFELRGEGTLPTLQIEKPKETEPDGTPALKFRKTRIGRDSTLSIVLKNEGSIAATARFDVIKNEAFSFLGNLNHTITPKTYQQFDIKFTPKGSNIEKFLLTFNTQHNPFEQHKVLIVGEGYQENVTFEGLPDNHEDELIIGDCIVNKAKSATFQLVNNGERTVKFRWNQGDKDEFKFYPQIGHLKAKSSKQIKVAFKSQKTIKYDKIDLLCETFCIEQKPDPETGAKFRDWDDTMKTVRMVRPSEYRKIIKQREDEEKKRKEEAEAAALAAQAKKPGQKPPAKQQPKEEPKGEEIVIDMNEDPTVELIETIPEVENSKIDGSDRNVPLKTTLVCDYAKFDCQIRNIEFKPTFMYASRSFKFSIKNTSLITLNYNFKIVNSDSGILDAGPYSIIPKKGTISAGCDDNFIVKFSPVECEADFSRILSANIENLSPDLKPLIIEVNGVAERPIVHFELPPSSYKERKEKDMVPIDNKYKIIEFESLGTNIKNTKRFMAVNPTSAGYEFEWEEVQDENKKLKPMFKCLTPKGVILSGKKFEMIFEYTPDNVGEHESYWIFKVPSEKIDQNFMVVGRVVEPNVLFETGKIDFKSLLLEGKNREVANIINQELIPFSFNFSKESVKGSPDYGDSLKINPMSGVVPPQSQIPIEVIFQPKFELTYNYNLICNVKRKARPLVLNVKGEGFKIHHSIFADISKSPVSSTEPYKFEFGDFFINEKKSRIVYLQNNGKFTFDYVWKRQINKYITITPETGSVQIGQEIPVEITYLPIAEHQLKNYKVSLNIVSGPKYDFLLNGNARKPGVKLSFAQYDFGPCFVMRQPMPKKAILEITNFDTSAISVEIANFEKKAYLDVQLAPGQVLLPSTKEAPLKLEVPIIFTPREIKKYQETITFDLNNLYTMDVVVTGEGIPMQLELVDPDQAVVDFGIVSVGGDITKTVQLVNKSKKPVTFQLMPSNAEQFKKCAVTFNPDQEMTLKPREQASIEIRYNPKNRMPNFNLEIQCNIKDNESRQLIQVQGVSHGIELKLMDEVIAFGSVVKNSRLTKILQLSNFGDVKAYFKWDKQAYQKFFTINPESGYVNPNSNLDLEVTFHPSQADPDIRCNKVKCEIKGGDSVFLTMMGKSVEQDQSSTRSLDFNTMVRKQQKQVVSIQNTEDKEWVINPTISTISDSIAGYFSGKSTLQIPQKQTAQYEILYTPKTMTKKNGDQYDAHQGSLFFPLPNGTALLYNLNGIATEPEAEILPAENVQAKKSKFIIIPIRNWLKIEQRFKVSWVVEGDKDQTVFIKGANMLDLGGESTKDFKLNFLAYKQGTYKVKVTFMNDTSGEYLSYIISVQVLDPDLLDRIELSSPIRESISKVITIENPTENEVTIARNQFVCNNEYIDITPDQLKIPPRQERGFEINYRPLMQTEQEVDLILKNPILGDFKYKLLLKGLPASSQRSMAFRCALGGDHVQAFKFTHYLKKPTPYAVKIEKLDQSAGLGDFKIEGPAQVQAPAADSPKGVEVSVNVRYEPQTIGDGRAMLKITSTEGMEYTCLLLGQSTAPLPQGPIKCIPGAKPIEVEFKNPLNEKCEFAITFDNPNFSLGNKLPGPLDPGKPVKLAIKYDAKADLPNAGRMILTAKGLPPWIYYLQGE